MNKLLAILLILLYIAILIPFNANAVSNTFSIHGTVTEENCTPIPGTTITLSAPSLTKYTHHSYYPNGSVFATLPSSNGSVESVNVTAERDTSVIRTTVTDNNGSFEFVNVTASADYCELRFYYPDHKQYFPPGNSFRYVDASGIQYVNVTRIKVESDAPPGYDTASGFEVVIAVACIIFIVLSRDKK